MKFLAHVSKTLWCLSNTYLLLNVQLTYLLTGPLQWSLSLRFPHQNPVHPYLPPPIRATCLGPFTRKKDPQYPLYTRLGGPQGPDWTGVKKEIFLPPTGVKSNKPECLIPNNYGKGYSGFNPQGTEHETDRKQQYTNSDWAELWSSIPSGFKDSVFSAASASGHHTAP